MRLHAIAVALVLLAFAGMSAATTTHAASIVDSTSQQCTTTEPLGAAVTHRAGLVVTFGDRHTEAFCIEFSEDSITGLEQLQRSGLPLVTTASGGLGAAVCSIGGEGSSDPNNCFSSCGGGTCQYWAFYRYTAGAWKFSQVGASQSAVHDGDILGWSWGSGGIASGTAPAPPGDICPEPTATATSTPIPNTDVPSTSTPVPTSAPPTRTPLPTKTNVPPTPAPSGDGATPPPGEAATPPPSGEAPPPEAPPAPSPESAVEAAARAPASVTATSSGTPARTATSTSTPTPKSGSIVIGEEQGKENIKRSEAQAGGGGGSRLSLIFFGIVAIGLIGAAGGLTYWRRRAL